MTQLMNQSQDLIRLSWLGDFNGSVKGTPCPVKNAPCIQEFFLSNISRLLQNVFYQLEAEYHKHTLDFL